LFLDCVLDNTFKDLDFIYFPSSCHKDLNPPSHALLDIIAKRCHPLLQSLALAMDKWNPVVDLEIKFGSKSFANFKNLTQLCILAGIYPPATAMIIALTWGKLVHN
jgi:hypothetical protein